jgi:hypothetical protein
MQTITQAITANELQYRYSWTTIAHDNPRITGVPDSTLLNRAEGYEVLHFINRFCATHNINQLPLTKNDALKVERMIHNHPGSVRSHANVTAWIESNWANYP